MRGPARIARGLLTDPQRPVNFHFDGEALTGLQGDTLAAALLASGRQLTGRSFKYHRPRGIVTAGAAEPCALVDVLSPLGREPNCLATTLALYEGLRAESQNRWPSLRFDVAALNDLFGRFLPAGFYYKTFMWPPRAWERVYEPLIRRAAGLGRLRAEVGEHALPAETVHEHTDVLIVGAGPAGLAATACLAGSDLRVLLCEQDVVPGGGTLLDERWTAWREAQLAYLRQAANVRCLTRTTVLGAYGHGVFVALESLVSESAARFAGLRERLRLIRARRVLFTTGAEERLIAFAGNDVPGVMLAGAALSFLRRYGVAVGRQPVCFVNNDEAYRTVFALADAGIVPLLVLEARCESLAAERARARGVRVELDCEVRHVVGRAGVRAVDFARRGGGGFERIAADCLLLSGGHSPLGGLALQLGARAQWQEPIAAFVPALDAAEGATAGAVRGIFGLAAAARDGAEHAAQVAAALGRACIPSPVELPADEPASAPLALWEVAGGGKAFVDLQNDVTTADVRLAVREGYEHLEHMKRYTTHGMATDQGRSGGLLGSAILAQARGVSVSEVGPLRPRPFAQAVPFAALAGSEVRAHYKPVRRLPLHDWHAAHGATFVASGLWLRPLVYSRESGWAAVLREARTVRTAVGLCDVSTLGKIDVQGADAARFLDFVYANTFSTLPVGRARYGIMLREDGMLFDDGTTSRLGAEHFLITTTTANAAAVLEHLEFHLQSVCAHLEVHLTDVADEWAQFAIAGPRARDVLGRALGVALSNEALPFMGVADVSLGGFMARLFRISFSGELAYELAVPADQAEAAWQRLLAAGADSGIAPYGLDALNTLRIEKGHVTSAELNGNTTADDLGLGRLVKKQGDFIGRGLLGRPGLKAPDRLQLVGVRPIDPAQRLRNGLQLCSAQAPEASLGYVTSCTPSVELQGWVGLALLCGGRERLGEHLTGLSPLHGESVPLTIVSPHLVDAENLRVRA
jgi:methylglutamate dehydrogenase subunit C